jgi:hypothetical protein
MQSLHQPGLCAGLFVALKCPVSNSCITGLSVILNHSSGLKPSAISTSEVFDSHRLENSLIHVPHITAEHQARRYTEPTSFSDPEKAARKLIEIANAAESVQDQRVHIELIPRPFLHAGGSPDEYRAGLERAIANGWLGQHESGVYVKFTQAGCGPVRLTRADRRSTAPRWARGEHSDETVRPPDWRHGDPNNQPGVFALVPATFDI